MSTHRIWKRRAGLVSALVLAVLATGCATQQPYDYTAYRQHAPKSIVVLPPANHSPEVGASEAVLSLVTYPLAESGYYVLPVAVVEEVFKQNGILNAEDARAAPAAKLQEIFGADAALYLDVRNYGTSYAVISSATVVTLDAKLVDLASGKEIWSGSASASSAEQNSGGGGLIGALVMAVVNQIVDTVTDKGYTMAGVANQRLLAAGRPNGLLYGPHSPRYGTD